LIILVVAVVSVWRDVCTFGVCRFFMDCMDYMDCASMLQCVLPICNLHFSIYNFQFNPIRSICFIRSF
jgi:hypothetical protein